MMNSYKILPKRHLYLILLFCSIIIFAVSIDSLIRVKDYSLYEKWVQIREIENSNADISFSVYISTNLAYLFYKIIVPLFLSLNTYFVYTKTRINYLFVIVWSMLILGSLLTTSLELSYYSIFYYIEIISYIILLIIILSLVKTDKNF